MFIKLIKATKAIIISTTAVYFSRQYKISISKARLLQETKCKFRKTHSDQTDSLISQTSHVKYQLHLKHFFTQQFKTTIENITKFRMSYLLGNNDDNTSR